MRDFANLTNTDEIYAQTILQDVNWNVEVTIVHSSSPNQILLIQAALEVHFGTSTSSSATTAREQDADADDSAEDVDVSGLEVPYRILDSVF